jgi:glycerophosphoryl diester phosphodiesterase
VSLKRIGHGGASALAHGNTLASFDVALGVGVDMIEFDVRRVRGRLVLAHTILDGRRGGVIRLADALVHLGRPEFGQIELNVDIKHPGCEDELLGLLGGAGLLERTLLSSQLPGVLDRIGLRDARARRAISVGGRLARMWGRRGDWRTTVLSGLARGRWEVLMAQHRLVDAALLEEVSSRGGQLYAWTVNERERIQWLCSLGVHGIASADPRLFSAAVRAG